MSQEIQPKYIQLHKYRIDYTPIKSFYRPYRSYSNSVLIQNPLNSKCFRTLERLCETSNKSIQIKQASNSESICIEVVDAINDLEQDFNILIMPTDIKLLNQLLKKLNEEN